ncbi:la-related protein 6B [Euphorbia lathyris]|uniref:la-related protein 6B n=1 Tax=Euphorbia lathyris TaxID=212925 RepID=UPI0033138562
MAQEREDAESSSQTLDHSHSSSSSSSDPSLSRNASFSKLNAQAPAFVPARPQQPPPPPPPPRLTVVPPPSPPALMHIYPQPPHSPFHVPIHSPVPVSHVIPVQNHHPHHAHHHNHHQHHHHNQQYVPVRNHNNHHQGQNSHYVPVQYHGNQQHQNHYGTGSKQGQLEEELDAPAKKDVAPSDHASKSDKNGLSDEAMQKLLNQVEYYFSDLNLATTDHLMRFINKDPEGYVPISIVASFKKIKVAIHSNFQLASILRNSSKLVVSEDGKKVRRQHPLTESDVEELQTRIVVAENLPEDHCHQNLMKIFSTVGSVKTIRTCPPQTSGGGASSASRSAKVDGMHFSNKLHAFVEYESIEIAEKAVAELNDEENWRSGLKVRLMLKRTSKPTQGRGKKGHDGQGHSEEEEVSTSEQQPNEKQNEDCSQQYDNHSHEHSAEDHTSDKEVAQRKGRNRGRGKGRGRGQYHHNNRGNHGMTPSSNNPIIGEQPSMSKQPPGPRMPDGTRGFAMGRGKPVAVNIT